MISGQRERDRQTETEMERDRDGQRQRERERETDRQTDRQMILSFEFFKGSLVIMVVYKILLFYIYMFCTGINSIHPHLKADISVNSVFFH